MKIIDVSQFNGVVDWAKAKPHIDGAIIRVGYRGYGKAGTLVKDEKCLANLNGAEDAGVPVGVYFVSQATTTTEAIAEADFVHKIISGYNIALPVYLDSEWSNSAHNGRADKLNKRDRTTYARAFCDRISAHGYKPGVYASESWFRDMLEYDELTKYSIWVAKYSSRKPSTAKYDGWQYTDKGSVPGLPGAVDISAFTIEIEEAKEADAMKYYKTIADVPDAYRPAVQKAVDAGALNGYSNGALNVSEDLCRTLTILDRLGVLDK